MDMNTMTLPQKGLKTRHYSKDMNMDNNVATLPKKGLTLFSLGDIMAPYSFSLISPERLELRPSNFLTFSFYLLAFRKI